MSDQTINIDIKVNTQEAIQDMNTFSEGVKEKVSEIKQLQEGFSKAKTHVDIDQRYDPFVDYKTLTGGIETATMALSKMRSGLESISKLMSSGDFTDSMTEAFRSMYQTIATSMESYSKSISALSKKSFNAIDKINQDAMSKTLRTASATGMRAAEEASLLSSILSGKNKDLSTGLSASKLGSIMPALSMVAEKKAKSYQQALRGSASLDDLAVAIANDKTFVKTVNSISSGAMLSSSQMRNLAKASVLASNRLIANDKQKSWNEAGLTAQQVMFVTDLLPKEYRSAYTTYGRTGRSAPTLWETGSIGRNDEKAYSAFRSLVKNGNIQAIRLGQQAGLVRANNGFYEFSSKPNADQLSALANLAVKTIVDAKTSLPYYHIDRNSIDQEETLIRRQNKTYNAAMEVVEALSKHGVKPADVDFSSDKMKFIEGTKYNKGLVKIKSLGTPDQYVIPNVVVGENGQISFRDPKWKKENGVQTTGNDHFVTIGNSTITNLLGMRGNNTYGYGRDEEGNAIYRTPKLIKLNTTGTIGSDETIKPLLKEFTDPKTRQTSHIVDSEQQAFADRLNRLYNRAETLRYGLPGQEKEYVRAFADAESMTMVLKDEYDRITKEFADAGMANPFDNMDVTSPPNFGKAMKAIDVGRKKATPGFLYQNLGYKNNPYAALVDFSQLAKYAGVTDKDSFMRVNELLDGVSLFDPSVLNTNAQMRAGVGNTKFMGQAENWRKLLVGSHLLEKAYNSKQHRGLIDINERNALYPGDKGYSFYMPQIGLSEKEVSSYVEEMDRLAGSSKQQDIDRLKYLRDTFFFDIMDPKYQALISDSSVKGEDKFRVLTKELFEKQFPQQSPAKIREDGFYELTAKQQADYFYKALEKGGLWVNKTAADFSTDKDFIPESVATAIGVSLEERVQSAKNYEQILHNLETDENTRINELNKTATGRMLVATGNIHGSMANALIGSTIKQYEQRRDNQELFLPARGVENRLTGILPGSPYGEMFKGLFGVEASGKYRPLFHYEGDAHSVIMKTMTEEQQNAIAANARAARISLGRNPAAPGEYGVNIKNMGDLKTIQRALDALGMEYDDTVYTDPGLQFQLMTGDYDGDTAWVIRHLSEYSSESMQYRKEQLQKARETIRKRLGTTPEKAKQSFNPNTAITDYSIANANAQTTMGQSTSAIRNIIEGYDLNDPASWVAMAQAIDAYDRGTSEAMKTGEFVSLDPQAASASKQGSLFRRFVKQIYALSNDAEGANPNIFSTRLPLMRERAELVNASQAFAMRRKGKNVGDVFSGSLDSWLEQTFNPETKEGQAANFYGGLMKNFMGGYRLPNANDIQSGRLLALDWYSDIQKRRSAGEDVDEESSRYSSFVNRLRQLEEDGQTQERNAERIKEIEKERAKLIKEGTPEALQQAETLQAEQKLRSVLNRPMTDELKKANDAWDEEMATRDKEIKDQISKNQQMLRSAGVDENSEFRGRLSRVLRANPEALTKMNWSDVTPWMYFEMQKDSASGNRFTLSGVSSQNLLTGNAVPTHGAIPFNPYPHDDAGIMRQQERIMARELDAVNDKNRILPLWDSTEATVFGSLRHGTLEAYLKERMAGRTADASELLVKSISDAASNGASDLSKLNLVVKQNDDKSYSVTGVDATANSANGINSALGKFDPSTGKFVGGTLATFADAVIEQTLANGGRIANVEGLNYQYGGSEGIRALNQNEVSGRGVGIMFPNITYTNRNGAEIKKGGTFAPDLIMGDKNDRFTMYDYKSSQAGSYDALYQMMVYAKDIQNKANEWRKTGDKGLKKQLDEMGWSQYVDDQGNLKFDAFKAYNTATGVLTSINADQSIIDRVYDYYERGQRAKMEDARSGKMMTVGYNILKEALGDKYGDVAVTEALQKPTSIQEMMFNSGAFQGKNESYKNFIVQKYGQDEELLMDVNSFVNQQRRKNGNIDMGGFSPYVMYKDKLSTLLDSSTIDAMKEEFKDNPAALAELVKRTSLMERVREGLLQQEQEAVVNGFNDVDSYIRYAAYGTKQSSGLQAINSITKQIENAAAVREGLKQDSTYVNEDGSWKNKDIENRYNESLERQKKTQQFFESALPKLTENQIRQNNRQFESLIPEQADNSIEARVQDLYNKRLENVQSYIQQQEAYIEEYQNKLDQKDKNGELKFQEGSKEREAIEAMMKNAEANRDKALELFNGDYLMKDAKRQVELSEEVLKYNRDRQSRQTDRMISQMDRIKKGRAGYYSNSITGRAARQVQQELWQRQSMQDQYQTQLEQWQIEQKKYTDGNGNITNQEQYDNAAQHIEKLNTAIAQNKAAMASLNGVGGTTAAVFGQIGQAVDYLMTRLGRQMFQKALAEAKRFIQEFDSSMNEIQAITLKSGTQMEPIRKQTISKAIGMRTSVSNVANTEAALYRQGLSDQEVSSRTDAIIKFATVTKLNVTEATKIITTALQNDLVASAEQAMDALVALGDSAATTAAEIGKGMQKAAASAKVAGVSYAELTSLLTLGTSDTQLSGTQVGTALQTVFTRMRRISMSGFAADQNGDKTTASDAEAALQTIGVDLYSDKNQGKMRGAYEILRDIAKVWEHLSDVQKSLVTNAMAGTRQTNIFSTLMEGMSENGGERMDEYLGLADGSQGITQSKYEIAMQSLSAAMNEFKSSFDSMVESLVSNGTITGVIDGLSGIFQWISGIASTDAGRVGVVFSAIAAGITAIGVAAATAKLGLGPISTIIGLIVGLLAGGGLMGLTSLFSMPSQAEKAAAQREKDYQNVQDKKEARDSAQTIRQDAIDNVRKLGKAYEELKDSEDQLAKSDAASKLRAGLYELKDAFPELSEEILGAIETLSNWEAAVKSADEKGQEYLKKNAEQYITDVRDNQLKNAQAEYEARLSGKTFTQERIDNLKDTLRTGIVTLIKGSEGYDNANGDALEDFANGMLHGKSYTTNQTNLQTSSNRLKAAQETLGSLEAENSYDPDVEAKIKEIEGKISSSESDIISSWPDLAQEAISILGPSKGKAVGGNEISLLDKILTSYNNAIDKDIDQFPLFDFLSQDTLDALGSLDFDNINIENKNVSSVLESIYTDLWNSIMEDDNFSSLSNEKDRLVGIRSKQAPKLQEIEAAKEEVNKSQKGHDDFQSNFNQSKAAEDEHIKDYMTNLYNSNDDFKDFVDTRFSTNTTAGLLKAGKTDSIKPEDASSLMSDIATQLVDPKIVEQFQGEMEEINKSFAEDQIKEYINGFTTKQYGEEFMTTLLENMFKSEAYDENGKLKEDFLKEGHLDTSKIADWVLGKFNEYKGKKDPTAALVEANKDNAVFPYYFHRGQTDEKGFMDYESARDWIITHGGTMTDLTDKDKTSIYQSAGSNINALIQKANEGNANIMLKNFLEGKDYIFKDEKGKENPVHIGGLDSYETIQGLEDAYDRFGLNGEISTLLAQNPTMLGLYSMAKNAKPEDQTAAYQTFKEAAKKMQVGQVSGSAIYDAVIGGLQDRSLNVTDLRTDSAYTEVYAAFKSFAGEAADEYLNAIESGAEAGVDENIKKAVDKSVSANRIKEKMQFIPGYSTFSQNALTEMYGTDAEKFSLRKQQASSMADLDSYNAAVQRYREGKAREADFATIAARSMYSEEQLRNQYGSEAMKVDLQNEADMYRADKVAEANNTIEAMRNGKADAVTIARANLNYIKQGYAFDLNTHKFTDYKPKDEDEITFAARRASYNRQADESNLTPLWNALSDNTDWSDKGITTRLIKGKYESDQINKLLEDSTFRNALSLGLGENSTYMQNLANRRATGKAGTFDENYGEWMKLIFGDDYNDKNNGITSGKFVISQNMRDKYNELVQNGKGAALDELFSAMAGGDIFREILAGGEGDINSAIQQYADQKYTDLFKNVKNGQQLAHDVTMFKTGTAVDQAQTAEQYMNTVRAQQQAQWAIDAISKNSANNTAENRSMITSLLGLEDVDVKRMIDEKNTKQIEDMIKDRVKETQDSLLKMFNGFFDGLDMDNTDWNKIKAQINSMDAGPLKDMFDAIFAAYDFTKGTVNSSNVKNLGDLFDQAKTDFADRAQAYEGYTKLHKALSKKGKDNDFDNWLNKTDAEKTDQSFKELLNGIDKDFDWSSFMSKNSGAALILKMIQDEKMSPKDAAIAMQYSQFNGQQTSAYTDAMLTTLFGGGFGKDLFNNGEIDTSKLSDLSTLLETIQGDEAGAAALDELTSRFESLNNAINALNLGELENAKKYLRDFNEEIKKKRADDYAKYGDYAEDVANAMDLFSKNTKKASAAQKSFNQEMSRVSKNQYARNQWSKGKRDKDTISQIAQMTDLSESFIKDKNNKSLIDRLLKKSESADKKSVEAWANGMSEDLSQALTKSFDGKTIDLGDGVNIDLSSGSTNIDFGDAISQLGGSLNAAQQDIIKQLQQWGVKGHIEITKNGDTVSARVVIDSLGKGSKGSGGGGGGGKKKTAGEKLIEKQKQSTAINDHEIKMVQSQENYYEGRSELGYLNETINSEQAIRRRYGRRLEKQNKELHNQLKQTKRGSEEWYKLRDAIMANEEAQKENTNAIDANTRKIKENQSAIRKLRMDLEDTVKTEIETRIKEKRDMLEGRASMEQTILGIIQERYRKEWDLIKRDIDKKKEALEEEKKLIDERLQARKNAADKASKYEELTELQNQLAMISMDSTRTKDAADLRKRIADLQGDIAWGTAEDEANNQKDALDDRIQAYNEFEQRGDEALEKYLEDANNFAGEVNKVLKMSQKDLIKWLEKNDDEYKNSLNNTKKSIVEGWTDLYKQMKGITDTYWKEINKILGSKKSYINYMKGSSEYKNASKTEQKEMEYQWGLQYDNYTAALKTGSKYSHSDDWASGEGKKDGKKGGSGSGSGGGGDLAESRNENGGKPLHGYKVTGMKYVYTPDLDSKGKQKCDSNGNLLAKQTNAKINKVFSLGNSAYKDLTWKQVKQEAQKYIDKYNGKSFYNKDNKSTTSYRGLTLSAYKEGGVVDYTGPAWVDGTPTKPEAFLNAVDTKNIRDLLDAFNYIKSPRMTYYDTMKNMGNTNNSIGEVSVTINGATFEDDADYEKIAQRVGEEFAKELQRQGFSTARYNF